MRFYFLYLSPRIYRALFLSVSLFSCYVNAQSSFDHYPSKPVRFISPFSAGGGTDAVGRIIATKLSEIMGNPFVVDNRGGADGTIGTDIAAKASPDGYTLLVANMGTFCMTPNLRKTAYNPLTDFAPITQTTASSTALVVHPNLPIHSLKELVAMAKARPGQLNFGAGSNATALPMEMLKIVAGIQLNQISYKGTGPSVIGLLSGEVQVMFGGAIATVPHVKSGRLRAIAVAGDRRARAMPDVPTIAEQGFPGYEANSWNGIVAPASTPMPIIRKLNLSIVKVLKLEDVRSHMIADGAEPEHNSPEQFNTLLRNCHTKWGKVIKSAGLRD